MAYSGSAPSIQKQRLLPVPPSVTCWVQPQPHCSGWYPCLGNRIQERMSDKGQRVYQLAFQESSQELLIGQVHLNWTKLVILDTKRELAARKAREQSLYSGWHCAQLKILLYKAVRIDTEA